MNLEIAKDKLVKGKIAVTLSSFAGCDRAPLDLLKEKGLEVITNTFGRKLDRNETLELCSGCVGIIAGTEAYNKDILEKLLTVKVISRCGSGTDNIDLESARKRGIAIYNTPDAPTRAVAELTVGAILNLLRKISHMDRFMRNGKWEKQMGNLLCGKKIGIIGFGRIGQKVCELLSAFGAELAYCDTENKPSSLNCCRKNLEDILKWADIVTLHVSFASASKPLIGEREIRLMRKDSWLVNISRGGAVDEEALYQALKEGRLSGAAIDVFEQEPYVGPLIEFDNVLLTPHIGSYAEEARMKMEIEAAENLLKGLGNHI